MPILLTTVLIVIRYQKGRKRASRTGTYFFITFRGIYGIPEFFFFEKPLVCSECGVNFFAFSHLYLLVIRYQTEQKWAEN